MTGVLKKGRQLFFMVIVFWAIVACLHAVYFNNDAFSFGVRTSDTQSPPRDVKLHDLKSKASEIVKNISRRAKKHKISLSDLKNKAAILSGRKKNVEVEQIAMLKQKEDNKGKTNTTLLDRSIYNNERMNQQIQEAREAIPKLLTSMTSSVPVLLVTYMRSGSSWLGEITKQSKDSLYVYEPFHGLIEEGYYTNGLVCYNNDKCRQPLSDVESHQIIMKNLLQIYNCDISNLHPKVLKNVIKHQPELCTQDSSMKEGTRTNTRETRKSRIKRSIDGKLDNTTGSIVPKERVSPAICVKLVTKACKSAKYKVVKTIRLSMDLVQILMDFIPSLKVIHLVRDPRGITNSRGKSSNMKMARKTDTHSIALCKEMHLDIVIGQILRRKFSKRITMVMYEALAERPTEGAKYVYRFLDIKYDNMIEDWVYNSTHANNNNGFYGTQRSNASDASAHWRKELKFTQVDMIQKYCKDVINLLGYIPFKTETDLRNFNLTSRKATTLKGFI